MDLTRAGELQIEAANGQAALVRAYLRVSCGSHNHAWTHSRNASGVRWFCERCGLVRDYPLTAARAKTHRPRPDTSKKRADARRAEAAAARLSARGVSNGPSNHRRAIVIKRDGRECRYCERVVIETEDHARPDRLTIDHIKPRSKGGNNAVENLCVCCNECNTAKGDLSLAEWIAAKEGV